MTSCLVLEMEEGSSAASVGFNLTLAAAAIDAAFSEEIAARAAVELVGDGVLELELELPVDDAAGDDAGAVVEDDEDELEQALAPTARAKARPEVATAVLIRRTCTTFLTVFNIESLS
jgi:hypothetical protein